jgi:hypothetical protein
MYEAYSMTTNQNITSARSSIGCESEANEHLKGPFSSSASMDEDDIIKSDRKLVNNTSIATIEYGHRTLSVTPKKDDIKPTPKRPSVRGMAAIIENSKHEEYVPYPGMRSNSSGDSSRSNSASHSSIRG